MSEPILSPLKRVDPETVERWLRPPASLVSREKAQELLDDATQFLADGDEVPGKQGGDLPLIAAAPDLARTVIEQADKIEAELREARGSAAELMADEAGDLIVSLLGASDYDVINDAVKDYMHDWAAAFRAGTSIR